MVGQPPVAVVVVHGLPERRWNGLSACPEERDGLQKQRDEARKQLEERYSLNDGIAQQYGACCGHRLTNPRGGSGHARAMKQETGHCLVEW